MLTCCVVFTTITNRYIYSLFIFILYVYFIYLFQVFFGQPAVSILNRSPALETQCKNAHIWEPSGDWFPEMHIEPVRKKLINAFIL